MWGRIVSSVSSALDINLATLSGCIDIIVIPRDDGTLRSSPFHVRFGKTKLLRSREKTVLISVNDVMVEGVTMKLGSAGEAFFLDDADRDEDDYDRDDADESPRSSPSLPPRFMVPSADGTSLISQRTADLPSRTARRDDFGTSTADSATTSTIPANPSCPVHSRQEISSRSVEPDSSCKDASAAELVAQEAEHSSAGHVLTGKAEDTALAAPQTKASPSHTVSFADDEKRVVQSSRVEFSMCGHLLYGGADEDEHDSEVFRANLITHEAFDADPLLWYHPCLVVRFNGIRPLYPGKVALPLLCSWAVFGRPLSFSALQTLLSTNVTAELGTDKNRLRWSATSSTTTTTGASTGLKASGRSTLTHRRGDGGKDSTATQTGSGTELNVADADDDTEPDVLTASFALETGVASGDSPASLTRNTAREMSRGEPPSGISPSAEIPDVDECEGADVRNSSASPLANRGTLSLTAASSEVVGYQPDPTAQGIDPGGTTAPPAPNFSCCCQLASDPQLYVALPRRRSRKTLRPSSEQLYKMNLHPGANRVTFTVTSSLLGPQSIHGTIYLWPQNAKIIVSDVDGTITRSDVLGQLMPIVGRDWSHDGVADLFSKIRQNGYYILYLTARAIGQADSTREYLFGLTQNEGVKLPDGPLILSPDRLFFSFKREVIDRKPYVFKIAALRDIRHLFPPQFNPFYAGFGNRDTDHRAYVHIGIPEGKVFIIDEGGVLHHINRTYAKTYESMSTISEAMFPPLKPGGPLVAVEDDVDDQFNSFNYWSIPPHSILMAPRKEKEMEDEFTDDFFFEELEGLHPAEIEETESPQFSFNSWNQPGADSQIATERPVQGGTPPRDAENG